MFAAIWEMVKDNWELMWWKWTQAMQNHAKNGEKNVYAIELLLYVLYAYIACGAIMIIGCILVWLGYLELPTDPNKDLKDPQIAADVDAERKRKKLKKMKWFSEEVVARHNTKKDCWVIVNSKVYNVSKFVRKHPDDEIVEFAGKDFTAEFKGSEDDLEDYLIGNLIEEKKDK